MLLVRGAKHAHVEASWQRGAQRGKETPAGQRSRREATQASVGHADVSEFYSEDNEERLKTKQPVLKSTFFGLSGEAWKKNAYPEATSVVRE